MTIYYVDSSSSAASDRNSGVSASAPLASLAAVNKLALRPGDTVAFKAGTSCAASASNGGALTITASGTASAPITFTTYGSGPAAVIGNTAAGYSDAIQVANAQHVVIDGLKLADAGQAGINVTRTSSHVTIRNVEATHVGEGVMLNGTDNLVTHSDFHDLTMVKNTANVLNDDYGAIGVMIGNSNNEVSFTKIVNAKAPSYDYGQDGGGIELFGTLSNIRIHDNWVENSEGFIEAGGIKSSLSNISIVNNVSLNNGNFLTLHNGGGAFASSFSSFDVSHNTVVEENNRPGQSASVMFDSAANTSGVKFKNNVLYLNTGSSFFKQTGDYHSGNVFYKPSSTTHLYTNWGMALGRDERWGTLQGPSGSSIVARVAAQSGGAGATLTSVTPVGLAASRSSLPPGDPDPRRHPRDTIGPSVRETSDRADLAAGRTATITFTFSETVTGFDAADISARYGTLSDLRAVSGTSYTARYTAPVGDRGSDTVAVAAGSYTDVAGHAGGGSSLSLALSSSRSPAGGAVITGKSNVDATASYDLQPNVRSLTLLGASSIDGTGNDLPNTLTGNDAANRLYGLDGDDSLRGNAGADRLDGGNGNDYLSGGAGDDTLIGGAGSDTLYGGSGADTFAFQALSDFGPASAMDVIGDFSAAEGDRIDLRAIDANSLVAGDQAFRWFGTGGFDGRAGELHYARVTGGNLLVSGDVNGDRVADFQFLVNGTSLSASDFRL
ncbi:Ig-like domain-containing protein [Methylobacterium sp. JK268]